VNKRRIGLVLLLSLCVLVQMLGVPASMFEPGGSFALEEGSLLEGWSIHVRYAFVPPSSYFMNLVRANPMLNVPILAGALFRPPLD
jgi:hypothetical protein